MTGIRRASWKLTGLAAVLAFATLAQPAAAEHACSDLIFRAFQGDYEQSFFGNEEIVLRPGQEGHIRLYLRSDSEIPHTLSAHYGHPNQFGLRGGEDPHRVRQVIAMNSQSDEAASRAKVNFSTGREGTTTIAYHIFGATRDEVFRKVPEECRKGVLRVRVTNALPASNPAPVAGPAVGLTGLYDTDRGRLELRQDGSTVTGTYGRGGRLEGTLRGGVVNGTWTEGGQQGSFLFMFYDNYRGFSGVFNQGASRDWQGPWNGQHLRR